MQKTSLVINSNGRPISQDCQDSFNNAKKGQVDKKESILSLTGID